MFSNINQFVFDFLYHNYTYVDSVLKYDSIAHAIAPSYNSTYYQIYWQLAGNFTNMLFNNASHFITDLVYTAWVNSRSPVSVTPSVTSLPEKYYLEQNYPNPFNPTTKIKFEIPQDAGHQTKDVKLEIFDVMGKEVGTLVNEQLQPGSYEVEWNAANYPSGAYFYKLSSDVFSDTKRMFLIK